MIDYSLPAQGELRIYRLPSDAGVPVGFTPMVAENGHYIVGHSESSHHHVLDPKKVEVFVSPPDSIGMSILRVIVREPTALTHLRAERTHAPIPLEPGVYEIAADAEWDYLSQMTRKSQD